MGLKNLELQELVQRIEEGAVEPNFIGVEFKSDWKQDHGKDISAIANHLAISRGWLVIGLDDKGVPLTDRDLAWVKKTEEQISNHIRQFLTPGWTANEITSVKIKNKECLAIEIRNPGDVVYWNNMAYQLIGTTSAAMKPHDVTALSLKLPGTDFSKMKYAGKTDPSLVIRFSQKMAEVDVDFQKMDLAKATPEDLLRKLNVFETQVAGILFGDTAFRFVHFDENGDIFDQRTILGIYNMLSDQFVDEVLSWTRKQGSVIKGTSTSVTEENPYPVKGLREILANAVAHSHYQRHHGDIVVELHPNRITISNLCSLDAKAFVNKWFSRAHKSHNKHLMNALRACKITDEQGSGKIRVFRYMLEEGRRQPIIDFEDLKEYGRWKITLFNDQANEALKKLYDRMTENFTSPDEARIAQALLLWRKSKWSEIVSYLDENYKHMAETILENKHCPVVRIDDRLFTKRWAVVALEGQITKQFTEAEKNEIYAVLNSVAFRGVSAGNISSEKAREIVGLSNTQSEVVQMSRLFTEWESKNLVKNVRKGHWAFNERVRLLGEA